MIIIIVRMISSFFLFFFLFFLGLGFLLLPSEQHQDQGVQSTSFLSIIPLEQWIPYQRKLSLKYLFANIHPNGTSPGCIVASTSHSDPPYFYYWVRDGAIVVRALLPMYQQMTSHLQKKNWTQTIWDFFKFNQALQWTPNLSQTFDGLAMTFVDAIPFYRNAVLSTLLGGKIEEVHQWIYRPEWPATTLTKLDLEVTAKVFPQVCFDLWEEVLGLHYYTLRTQFHALRQGAKFATLMKDVYASTYYASQAHQVASMLNQSFYTSSPVPWLAPTVSEVRGFPKPSRLDTSVILAALHTYEWQEYLNDFFLATVDKLAHAFHEVYPINHPRPLKEKEKGSYSYLVDVVGRYPEDVYQGGHPWYLTTLALAEVHYRIGLALTRVSTVHVTTMTHAMYMSLTNGTLRELGEYSVQPRWIHHCQDIGDLYLRRVQQYIPDSGALSEQFHKVSGSPLSARHLTWSYAAFLSATHARQELLNVHTESWKEGRWSQGSTKDPFEQLGASSSHLIFQPA
ncbi:hypothetical protein HMI54_002101 [Coelomomyces lativittatus]|nr:hypothetical protein HMI54_002101 [Coelomomyces lativittatus]